MRVVVTGGAGFLGSHLCERLLELGHDVHCVDNLSTGQRENLASLYEHPGFHFHCQDACDYLSVPGPVDAVLHLASPASPTDYARLPIATLTVGSRGTHRALGLARAKGARFLLASTSETYGDPQIHPQPESYWGHVNPIGPRSVYDEAKRFAEALTMAYHRAHGLDTRIVRIFNTYGPRMRPRDGRVISTFVRQALSGEPLTVAGDGRQTRSFCYVSDLVEGLLRLLACEHPQAHAPVNLGNAEEHAVAVVARLVLRLTGSASPIAFVPLPADDPKVRRPALDRARQLLGWEPAVGLEAGLRWTIAWFSRVLPPAAAAGFAECGATPPAPASATH
ncbi:MAG: UDP-glucuronic acid decarboxylase family protein [Terriglobales bacterium]